jgi:hypothetical protein
MTFNEYLFIARAEGIEIECERVRRLGKMAYAYRLFCEGKHGQKFTTLYNPDSQLSKEMENDLFRFLIRIQEQDIKP